MGSIRTSFWTYFSSALGTIIIVLFVVALISNSNIDTGLFGLVGFPLFSLIYAAIRVSSDTDKLDEIQAAQIKHSPNLRKFLTLHPEFGGAPVELRDKAFKQWLIKGEH